MPLRGIRGAVSVESNEAYEILLKTRELLEAIAEKNSLSPEDIASIVFSVTDDINAAFPAEAARKLGWVYTPLFSCREIPVKQSLKGIIRVLLHVNTNKPQKEIVHVYLDRASALRPDISEKR